MDWPKFARKLLLDDGAISARETALLGRHGKQWFGALNRLGARDWVLRRGLVERVTMTAHQFLANGEGLLDLFPICTVKLVLGLPPNGTSTDAELVMVPIVRSGASSGPRTMLCTLETAVVTTVPSSLTRLFVCDSPPPMCSAPETPPPPPMASAFACGLPSATAWMSRKLAPPALTPLANFASDGYTDDGGYCALTRDGLA